MITKLPTIKELDGIFFKNIFEVMKSTDATFQFNNEQDNSKIFTYTNRMIKEYMKVMDSLDYFKDIYNNKEVMKKMKKSRKNLGENMYYNIFKTILNEDMNDKKYIVEIKSVCPIDILYDALVRQKTYKIPPIIEMVYIRILVFDEEVSKYKLVYTFGKDITENEYVPMETV